MNLLMSVHVAGIVPNAKIIHGPLVKSCQLVSRLVA